MLALLSMESEAFVDTGPIEAFNYFLLAGETSHLSDASSTFFRNTDSKFYNTANLLPQGFEKMQRQTVNYARAFTSIGQGTAGDLHAWTTSSGAWDFPAANELRVSGGSGLIYGGHPLWGYGMRYRARFAITISPGQAALYCDYNPAQVLGTNGNFQDSWIRGRADGTNLYLETLSQLCVNTPNVAVQAACALTIGAGNWYWMEIVIDPSSKSSPKVTVSVYNDSGGSIGTLITSISAAASGPGLTTGTPDNGTIYGGWMGLGNANSSGTVRFGGNGVANTITADLDTPEFNYAFNVTNAWAPSFANSARESGFAVVPLGNPTPAAPFTTPWTVSAPFSPSTTSWRGLSIYTPPGVTQAQDFWVPTANSKLIVSASAQLSVYSCYVQTVNVSALGSPIGGASLLIDQQDINGAFLNTVSPNGSTTPFAPYSQVNTQGMTRLQYYFTTGGSTAYIALKPCLDSPGLATFTGLRAEKVVSGASGRFGYFPWN